jgi:hypothetical protein
MTDQARTTLLVVFPLLAVWVIVLVDIARQPRMRARAKWIWALMCTAIWPTLIVYWLTRPMQGRSLHPERRADPHARLADAALAHEAGRIDDSEMTALAQRLRSR